MAIKKNVVYIRNKRPNQINMRFGPRERPTINLQLGRRGKRDDTAAIPADEVERDQNFQKNVKLGLIEIISEQEFLTLGGRIEDEPLGRLKPPPSVLFQMKQEGVIDKFDKEAMTPHLEFLTPEEDENTMLNQIMALTGVSEDRAREMLALAKEEANG